MSDDILSIDVEVVRQAAGEIMTHYYEMAELFDSIRRGHDDVQGIWHGAAADSAAEFWERVEPAVGSHLAQIPAYAKKLFSDAATYAAVDGATSSELDGIAVR